MLTQELLSLGLGNKEADVYLAALQLGYASVQEIAQKAGINRTTAYTHIRNLISRGLILTVERNGKLYYVAERPEKLQYIYEQQEKEIQRKKNVLNNLMPQLESIYNVAKEKPTVRYYNNQKDLVFTRQEIQLLRADEMYNIFNYERFGQYINRRHLEKILDSVLIFKGIYIAYNKIIDNRLQRLLKNAKFQLRFLPLDKFAFLCEILIAGDRVYIARDTDSLLITDKLFSQTLTLLFKTLWEIAEPFS